MKCTLLSLLLLLLSPMARADDDEDLVDTTKLVSNTLTKVKEIGSIKKPCLQILGSQQSIGLDSEFSANGVNDNCTNFFTKDHTIGPWGEIITKAINNISKEDSKKSFLSNDIPDMNFICPNFNNFDDDLKKKFWVWTFAAISWQESSCKPKQTGKGVNSKAVGLLQLEDSRRLREGRGDNCEVKDIIDPSNNLACGVEILHQQLLGKNGSYFKTSIGELFWKHSYWQHLRLKDNTQINTQALSDKSLAPSDDKTNLKELVMRFPKCKS